jgi:hypothetical protein
MNEVALPLEQPAPAPPALEALARDARRGARLRGRLRSRLLSVLTIRVALAVAAYLVYAYINQGRRASLDYFVPLADAFLHGGVAIPTASYLNELVPIGQSGMGYVVYPPMPAIVMLPFVAIFGPSIDQAGISILFGAINVYLASGVLGRLGLHRLPWLVLTLVFAFGSIGWYSAQAGSSWHFAHVCATFFMLLAIRGTQVDSPLWLTGLLYAAAGLSRLPVLFAAPYFAAYLAYRARVIDLPVAPFGWTRPQSSAIARVTNAAAHIGWFDIGRFVRLAIPFFCGAAIPLILYLTYNKLRFGSATELGYGMIPGLLNEYQYRFGFLSYHNIPRNLYAMLLTPPRQVDQFPWIQPALLGGMSLVLTTPIFLWALRVRAATWFTIGSVGAVVLIAIPVLLHADPGGAQFGYRYAQDFYPFLLMLTAHGIARRIGFEAWLAVAIGFAINIWGMYATTVNWFA